MEGQDKSTLEAFNKAEWNIIKKHLNKIEDEFVSLSPTHG
jgi:hypothetical protein